MRSLVSVVDDDESVRELGFSAHAFSSAEEFLASNCACQTQCLILDIAMPGMSGPELQRELKQRGHDIPDATTTRARLIERGAVERLREAVNTALRAD